MYHVLLNYFTIVHSAHTVGKDLFLFAFLVTTTSSIHVATYPNWSTTRGFHTQCDINATVLQNIWSSLVAVRYSTQIWWHPVKDFRASSQAPITYRPCFPVTTKYKLACVLNAHGITGHIGSSLQNKSTWVVSELLSYAKEFLKICWSCKSSWSSKVMLAADYTMDQERLFQRYKSCDWLLEFFMEEIEFTLQRKGVDEVLVI